LPGGVDVWSPPSDFPESRLFVTTTATSLLSTPSFLSWSGRPEVPRFLQTCSSVTVPHLFSANLVSSLERGFRRPSFLFPPNCFFGSFCNFLSEGDQPLFLKWSSPAFSLRLPSSSFVGHSPMKFSQPFFECDGFVCYSAYFLGDRLSPPQPPATLTMSCDPKPLCRRQTTFLVSFFYI